MNRGVGGGVVDESHVGGFFEGIFVVLDNSEQRIYSIVCLRVGLCPLLVMCKRVEKFRVGCQSRNKKAFEEFLFPRSYSPTFWRQTFEFCDILIFGAYISKSSLFGVKGGVGGVFSGDLWEISSLMSGK